MKVRFWGVRGSFPVPGVSTVRYGGNTSCVEVRPFDDGSGPRIIIDAGTGLRKLGKELMAQEFGEGKGVAHLLVSHTHWDHIQGLPFFSPMYQKGNRFNVYARHRDDTHLRAVFASQSDTPYFPVPFDKVQADVAFRELVEGAQFEIGPVKVSCTRLNHPWIAMAYRLECDGASIAYVTDTAPFRDILIEEEFIRRPPQPGEPLKPEDAAKLEAMRAGVVRLCEGADLVIYDTQFTPDEYLQKPHWGHSTADDAIEIARAAGAKSLALFHHAPERSDDAIDAILEVCRADEKARPLSIVAAAESLEVTVGKGGTAEHVGEDGKQAPMEITLHGVRGSIPVPGPETPRYGGNTSCASVRLACGQRFILDAGTGIIALGRTLMAAEFGRGEGQAALLLTHSHWDHIQGFPFFPPVFVPGNRFTLYGPGRSPSMLEGILEGQMNPHFSPLHTMKNLGAAIELVAVHGDGAPIECGEAKIRGHLNPHGTTTALAWRIDAEGKSIIWAPDAGYAASAIPDAAIEFYRGADLLVHDATYSPEDWAERRERGFSSIVEAITAAARAQVKHLVLTHYDPDYSDEKVDSLVERSRRLLDEAGGAAIALSAAAEGMTITL